MAATIHTIPSNNLSQVNASHSLRIGSSTYVSSKWNGVNGISEGVDGIYDDCKYWNIYVPYNQQDMHLKDFLDIRFEHVATIGGRYVNVDLHCDSLDFIQEAVINQGEYHKDGYMQIMTLYYDVLTVIGESAGSMRLKTSVTITYADTGEIVDLPFYQRVEDIDAKMPYISQPESWEGISGFTNDLYVYQPYFTGGIMEIEGMKASACIHSLGAENEDSLLKAGLFAPIRKGSFTCEWGENNCGTSMLLYSAYDDRNLPKPIKKTDAANTKLPGETINYTIEQPISSFYANAFGCYNVFAFVDKLSDNVSYVSAELYHNGVEKTSLYGTLQYDEATHTVRYTLKESLLKSISFYDGTTLSLKIKAKVVNASKQTVTAKNKASVDISGVRKQTNEVQTLIDPQFEVITKIENGTITPSESKINKGADRTVTWTPKNGYYVESVTIDGVVQTDTKTEGDSYIFRNIKADHDVKVVCKPYFQIQTEISNGIITKKISEIKEGENHGITWTAKEGYYVESVTVDGDAQLVRNDDEGRYTFSNVTADHYVKVVCKPYYRIETQIDHGTITPDQDRVKEGDRPKIVWTPEDGYYVKTVTVDNAIIYSNNATKNYDTSYSFSPISENHKVVVKTARIPSLKITKNSDKNVYNYQDIIIYTIVAEQTIKGAVADHVIITDKDITKGIEFDLDTLKVSDPSAKIDKNKDSNSFTVRLDQMSDSPVTITVKATVNNETLKSKEIKNTARIISDQTEEITDDSDISIFYKVITKVTNGSISPNDDKVGRGENRVITYQPADDSYYLESVKIDGQLQDLGDCQDKVILEEIKANHFVEVIYEKIPDLEIKKSADRKVYSSGDVITYTIQVSQPVSDGIAENVTIYDESLPEGVILIPESVSCDEGMAQIQIEENGFRVMVPYLIADKTVTIKCKAFIDGKKSESDMICNTAKASFKNVEGVEGLKKASTQIQVRQKILTEVVHGSITDSESDIPLHADREITYQAEKGYYLESVTVDGEKVSITDFPDRYKFADICADHTIQVVYNEIPIFSVPFDPSHKVEVKTRHERKPLTKKKENSVPLKKKQNEALTPNPTATNTLEPTVETKHVPEAGDRFPLVPISGTLLASFCMIIFIRKRKKKEGENRFE